MIVFFWLNLFFMLHVVCVRMFLKINMGKLLNWSLQFDLVMTKPSSIPFAILYRNILNTFPFFVTSLGLFGDFPSAFGHFEV
jgi:hypothetical protein